MSDEEDSVVVRRRERLRELTRARGGDVADEDAAAERRGVKRAGAGGRGAGGRAGEDEAAEEGEGRRGRRGGRRAGHRRPPARDVDDDAAAEGEEEEEAAAAVRRRRRRPAGRRRPRRRPPRRRVIEEEEEEDDEDEDGADGGEDEEGEGDEDEAEEEEEEEGEDEEDVEEEEDDRERRRGTRRGRRERGRTPGAEAIAVIDRARFVELDILPEDVLDEAPLRHDEMTSFLEIDFREDASAEAEHAESELLFVEDFATGRFHRTNLSREQKRKEEAEKAVAAATPKHQTREEKISRFMASLSFALSTMLLLAQGLLAGVALYHLYLVTRPDDAGSLLSLYVPLASESRRMFYLLTTIAFVAAWDKLARERSEHEAWRAKASVERLEPIVSAALYFVAMLATLVSNPMEVMLQEAGFSDVLRASQCTSTLQADTLGTYSLSCKASEGGLPGSITADDVTSWYLWVYLRVVACLFGWVFACRDVHRELARSQARQQEKTKLAEQLAEAKETTSLLAGKFVDELSVEELEMLHRRQLSALKQTERVLQLHRGRHGRAARRGSVSRPPFSPAPDAAAV
eukprot:PLAT15952.1.p1 GENE.PLAT15952.1~~PLAT15952.1.p1  ORF type:complete len:574 (-),score=286.61 PLAT15952.1:74-1795(-)